MLFSTGRIRASGPRNVLPLAQASTKRLSVLGFLREAANHFMAGHGL
jgi:hypothetical protein